MAKKKKRWQRKTEGQPVTGQADQQTCNNVITLWAGGAWCGERIKRGTILLLGMYSIRIQAHGADKLRECTPCSGSAAGPSAAFRPSTQKRD
jgi:hypothetical protein